MKKQNLKKIITMGLIATSLIAVAPVRANAEWKQDNTGWWYTEGNSYATGWRNISGQWYYFENDGYMAKGWYADMGKIPYSWYFLNDDGSMVTGTKEINGIKNRFDNSGKWISYTDDEINNILAQVTGKNQVINGSSTVVYDQKDSTDYSEFGDGFWNKDDMSYTGSATIDFNDLIVIKNHKRVLNGLVGYENSYYIENGKMVRNAWRKIDDTWYYFKADGMRANSSVDGFAMLFISQGIGMDRNTPYNKEINNVERTYYVTSISNSSYDRELNESEFNKYFDQGKIKFNSSGVMFPSSNQTGDLFYVNPVFE